jgi:hypothetical protein
MQHKPAAMLVNKPLSGYMPSTISCASEAKVSKWNKIAGVVLIYPLSVHF